MRSSLNNSLAQTIQLQWQASNPKNSVWVFASAGSGKTKILTDRVLRLLLEGVRPEKILCLTFTKAAAAEMQSRINANLASWVLLNDEELAQKIFDLTGNFPQEAQLKKARNLFLETLDSDTKIKAQTIHAFCQTLIKIFPFESGVSPNFEVIEEAKEKLLLLQAQKNLLNKALSSKALQDLVKKINANLSEENLSEILSQLTNKRAELDFLKEEFCGIDGVIEKIFHKLGVQENFDEQKILADFFANCDEKKILELAQSLENSDSAKNLALAFAIKNFFTKKSWQDFSSYYFDLFTKENSPRKIYGKVAKDDSASSTLAEHQQLVASFFEKFNSLKIAQNSADLLRFANLILDEYHFLKKQSGLLDYDDLIFAVRKLLLNHDFKDWVKRKMDGAFDHVLVDESQDTNEAQWEIIKALTEDFFSGLSEQNRNRSIFIVGDEKQSIYSFQGSSVDVSAKVFAHFQNQLDGRLKKIELNNSFRSLGEILRAVDLVFADEARKNAISKISAMQEHKPIREGLGKVEIWPKVFLQDEEKKKNSYEWEIDFAKEDEVKSQEFLAKAIALKIKQDVLSSRAKYGDFMILLRNRTNGFNQNLEKFFSEFAIPFSSLGRVKFSENLLVQDLLSAAKFALLSEDDLNLAALLKSPLFDFDEDDLLEICSFKNSQKTTIYKALEKFPKFSQTYKLLALIKEKSAQIGCLEFFYFLLNGLKLREKLVAHFGGEALQIVDKFIFILAEFVEKNSNNLQKFLEFVENFDPEISLLSDENNAVKISTIHAAKGLQSRIVMLPDCAYNFNQLPQSRGKIFWIDGLPFWCSKKSEQNELIKNHQSWQNLAAQEEYLRLLYVAMTRAEDELYIGGFGKSCDEKSWYEIIKNSLPSAALNENFFAEIFAKEVETTEEDNEEKPKDFCFADDFSFEAKTAPSLGNTHQNKGELIHKILEIFGKNYHLEKELLKKIAKKFIEDEVFLSDEDKKEIELLTSNFLTSQLFDELFCGDIFCELPIAKDGVLNRIDLLINKENEVLIVDYKSDSHPSKAAFQQHLEQLKTYKNLAEKLYPQKKISCAILWIRTLQLQFV